MRTVLNAGQMKAVDQYMIEKMSIPGLLLMENAAMELCNLIMEYHQPCTVHVFCGAGNNGGDGLAAARILLSHGYDVYVVFAGKPESMTPDTTANFAFFENVPERVRVIQDMDALSGWAVPSADVVIDAIFGTGLVRNVGGVYKDLIEYINTLSAYKVSADIPSGIHADTGAAMGVAVEADATVAFQYAKPGHYLFPGRKHTGYLEVAKIGVDDGCEIVEQANLFVYESEDEDICLGEREMNTNKGDYGRLMLVAGSRGMAGAAVLAAKAATRVGAGLVTVCAVEEVVNVVQSSVPEATCRIVSGEEGELTRKSYFDIERAAKGKTAMAIGPGLGVSQAIRDMVSGVISRMDITTIVDADAINALEGQTDVLRSKKGELVLTPHPKEFSRLTGMDVDDILSNPIEKASAFAQEYGVTLVLKGATTVVAAADGKVCLVAAGSPGMAKGGSGDVLTGVIAGLATQGKNAFDSALLGAYIAASAGEMAAEEEGEYAMTPSDSIQHIGQAMQEITVAYVKADRVEKEKAYAAFDPHEWRHEKPIPATENILEKTAEDVIAEIEEKEKTQEIKKVIMEELGEKEKGEDDNPTRRRIG